MGEANDLKGVEKSTADAERIQAVLKLLEKTNKATEGDIARLLSVDQKTARTYIDHLKNKGIITVNKRFFRESEIVLVKKPPSFTKIKKEVKIQMADKPAETPKQTTPPRTQTAPPKPIEAEKFIPETEEDFNNICKSLTTQFVGLMRLWCEIKGQSYSAGLMIYKGDIIASTFEHMDETQVQYGEDAMLQIMDKFMGTKGDLDVYMLSEESLNAALEEDKAILQIPIKLSTLNIKIKPRTTQATEDSKTTSPGIGGMFGGLSQDEKRKRFDDLKGQRAKRIENLNLGGSFSLVNFARNIAAMDPLKAKRFEELRKMKKGEEPPDSGDSTSGDAKASRLEELKARRESRLKISDILNKFKQAVAMPETRPEKRTAPTETAGKPHMGVDEDKRPVKKVTAGLKVETKIDKLYELVEKQGRLRINDALANMLKVNKTQIEEWAMILEEHDLIEVKYPTIGEPEMMPKKHTKEGKDDAGKR